MSPPRRRHPAIDMKLIDIFTFYETNKFDLYQNSSFYVLDLLFANAFGPPSVRSLGACRDSTCRHMRGRPCASSRRQTRFGGLRILDLTSSDPRHHDGGTNHVGWAPLTLGTTAWWKSTLDFVVPQGTQRSTPVFFSTMMGFIYRCPNTGQVVQGWSAEEISDDKQTYETVICLACTQPHFVSWSTGKVLGAEEE